MKNIFRHWKIFYLICCIAYMGFVVKAGSIEYLRINSQYRNLVEQLEPERIRTAALEELAAECLEKSRAMPEKACSSWPPDVVKKKTGEIERRQRQAKKRGTVKLVLFYTFFVLIFLLAPPVIIYLLLVWVIRLYKSITIVR